LAGWVRGQWAIENGLHWVRDVGRAAADAAAGAGALYRRNCPNPVLTADVVVLRIQRGG
jgi:hypothetical protein